MSARMTRRPPERTLQRRLVLVLLALLSLALAIPSPAASAASKGPQACNISTHTIFNVPAKQHGSKKQQRVLMTELDCVVKAALPNSEINIGMYSQNSAAKTVIKDLVRAHRERHVRITYAVSKQHADCGKKLYKDCGALQPLIDELNNTHNKWEKDNASFVKLCDDSCLDDGDGGNNHAKGLTASAIKGPHGTLRNITFIESGNWTNAGNGGSWNTTNVFVNDATFHREVSGYFRLMGSDDSHYNYSGGSVTSHGTTIYFYPCSKSMKVCDPVGEALDHVSCKAKKGFGDGKGHTVVRVPMFHWTNYRTDIAKRLVKLKEQGCDVQVIYNYKSVTKTIMKIFYDYDDRVQRKRDLKAHKKHPQKVVSVPVWNAESSSGYLHAKTTLISGTVNGKSIRWSFDGSSNFTGDALKPSTELTVKFTDKKNYDQHIRWYNGVRSHTSANVYKYYDDDARKAYTLAV